MPPMIFPSVGTAAGSNLKYVDIHLRQCYVFELAIRHHSASRLRKIATCGASLVGSEREVPSLVPEE